MPNFEGRSVLAIKRDLEVFVNLEAGASRGPAPESPRTSRRRLAEALKTTRNLEQALSEREQELSDSRRELQDCKNSLQELGQSLHESQQQAEGVRRQLREREESLRESEELRRQLEEPGGPRPENVVWIFGSARTGSTWLMNMLAAAGEHHSFWNEPKVGRLFGEFYEGAQEGERTARNFLFGEPLREEWISNIRRFVREAMRALRPRATASHRLIVKEPDGSRGAPLLMEALPESAMVLLVRDPRDVIASYRDAMRKGGWLYERRDVGKSGKRSEYEAEAEAAMRDRARKYLGDIEAARSAYESHGGRKALIRYEDLTSETRDVMRELFSNLQMEVTEEELDRLVREHSWQNIPEEEKGEGKFYRKGTSGSWREDLTQEQVEIVEEITAPLLEEFYPGTASRNR